MNLLAEFNKRYKGFPCETELICEEIARENGMDAEEVKDFIYINRWNDDPLCADDGNEDETLEVEDGN